MYAQRSVWLWGLNGRVLPPLDTPFDVDVFVSGYAYKLTGVGFNTRAGRAFLRLAKSTSPEKVLASMLIGITFQALPLCPSCLLHRV